LLRIIHHPDREFERGLDIVTNYNKNMRIALNTSDFIEWSIFFFGYYEPVVCRFLRKWCPPGGTAVDIGANIGCHTMVLAGVVGDQGKVLAFEPHPGSFSRLSNNLRLNNLENVMAAQTALSSSPGRAVLFGPGGTASRGVASFYRENIAGTSESLQVPVSTLDIQVKEANIHRLDVVKIDTEGHELEVLRGGVQTIEKYHPVILFEYSPRTWEASGTRLEEAVKLLDSLGYRVEALGKIPDKEIGRKSADMVAYPPAGTVV